VTLARVLAFQFRNQVEREDASPSSARADDSVKDRIRRLHVINFLGSGR